MPALPPAPTKTVIDAPAVKEILVLEAYAPPPPPDPPCPFDALTPPPPPPITSIEFALSFQSSGTVHVLVPVVVM